MEGEKDEEQIAEETDIKNKWSESEEERKKKQAMRRSDELIKLQTKPMQLRSKQAAYEVDPEMDEGEEKITRQLPAGAVGALKAFKELQRGFPWKQKWNGKEAEAPPKKSGALMTHGGRRMTHGGRRMQTSRVARTGGISRHHRLHHLRRPGLHHLRRPDQGSQPKRLSRLSQPRLQPKRLQPKRLQHVQRRPNSRETSWCRSSLRSRLHRQSHPRHCLRHHHRCQGLQRQDPQGRHRC